VSSGKKQTKRYSVTRNQSGRYKNYSIITGSAGVVRQEADETLQRNPKPVGSLQNYSIITGSAGVVRQEADETLQRNPKPVGSLQNYSTITGSAGVVRQEEDETELCRRCPAKNKHVNLETIHVSN